MSGDYSNIKADVLAELSQIISEAIAKGQELRFDKDMLHHQMMIGSYLAIVETSDSIRILLEADRAYDAEVLLRTLMELRVRLEVFANNKETIDRERVEFFKRTRDTLQEAKRGNKYLAEVAKHINVDTEIRAASKNLDDLAAKGIKGQLKFSQMCKENGFADEYRAIYSGLSQTPHGTYSSMIKRNFVVDWATEQFTVIGFRHPDIETVELVANSTSEWLRDAKKIVTEFLSASHIDQENA